MIAFLNRQFTHLNLVYPDSVQRQRAQGVNIIVLSGFLIWLIWAALVAIPGYTSDASILLLPALISTPLTALLAFWLVRSGRLRFAAWVVIIGILLPVLAVLDAEGLNNANFILVALPIITAGLVLPRNDFLIASLIVLSAVIGLIFNQFDTLQDLEGAGILGGLVAVVLMVALFLLFDAGGSKDEKLNQPEQENLSPILDTLPAGVLVLDAKTSIPLQFNRQIRQYLGDVDMSQPFHPEHYGILRADTGEPYPEDEMAISLALTYGGQFTSDDVVVRVGEQAFHLQVAASPIHNDEGMIQFLVVAFQDVTNLRQLEDRLHSTLGEALINLQTQQQLVEAKQLDDVYNVIATQAMASVDMSATYIILNNERGLTVNQQIGQPLAQPESLRSILNPQKILRINQLTTHGLTDSTRTTLKAINAQSLISVPLYAGVRSDNVGWLLTIGDQPDHFNANHERILTQIADMSATAIDNRLLLEEQRRTVYDIGKLYALTSNISRSSGSIEKLISALEGSLAMTEADYFAVVIGYQPLLAGLGPVLVNQPGDDLEPIDFQAEIDPGKIPEMGIQVEDLQAVENPDRIQRLFRDRGLRAVSVVDFKPNPQTPGFIMIGYKTPQSFTGRDTLFLNTLADSTSIVINNLLLIQQTQAALEDVSILYEAGRALSDAKTPADILDAVVKHLVPTQANQVFLAILSGEQWDSPAARVQIESAWSKDETAPSLEGMTLTPDTFPAWELFATPAVRIIDDINSDKYLDETSQTAIAELGAQSVAIIPLEVSGRNIGLIWIAAPQSLGLTDSDKRTYEAFGEQASLALEAAHLLDQSQYRARQLEISASVSSRVGQILDLAELLPQLVDLILNAFEYDHVQVFLIDEDFEYAELRASTGEAGQQLLAINHKLAVGSQSVIGQVTERGEPIIALDTAGADVVHAPNPYLPNTHSELALPLLVKGTVVGALDVQSNEANKFDDEDIRTLTTLAAQISVAIENASLYESVQEQASRMSFLFEITSAAAEADTLDETVMLIANRVQRQIDVLMVAIFLSQTFEDEKGELFDVLQPRALAGVNQPLSELEEIRVDDPSHALAKASRNMRVQLIDNIDQEPNYLPISADAQSVAILPLVVGNELIGNFVFEYSQTDVFDENHLQLLVTLTGSVTAVIQSKRLLEQIQRTNERLRELDRLKSDFLANMSHELRTPLNSIIGFSRVMLKGIDGPLTDMQEQDLTTIFNSGQHLLTLINDILDQAKINAHKLDLKFDYFEIKPVVEAVKSLGIGLVKEKNLSLITEIAPNAGKVYGDEMRTRQILINLVSNASKFTPQGGITIRCYPIQDEETGHPMMRIDVEDTGIGIAEKDLPLLFEAFRQVDSSLTRTQGGTGLGLPISKSLTELQGGAMTVASTVNVGTVFSITIPIEPLEGMVDENEVSGAKPTTRTKKHDTNKLPPPQSLQATTHPAITNGPPPTVFAKRDIVLIEDNKDMVDQFRRITQREGFEVITADHPSYAEAMVSNMRPTIILMDVDFAEGKGWDILSSLKERDDTFDIPIIVVTLNENTERAYQLGAFRVIQRPFVPEDLVEVVLEAEKESNLDRILIIDDTPEDVRLLTHILNENGTYRIFSANDGKEGMSMVARRRPDLIVLDLRMPDMDGFAVLDELRANPETTNIPILIVTGENNFSSDEQSRLSNIHVLPKTGISETEYDQFIQGIRKQLEK